MSSASESESGAGARDEEGVEALTMSCVKTGALVVAETESEDVEAVDVPGAESGTKTEAEAAETGSGSTLA
jgi:hypothetical protein